MELRMAYPVILLVGTGSVVAYLLTSNNEFAQVLVSIPGVASIIGLLVQIMRDDASHQRALELQNDNHRFVLGVSSHMGNTAFNKHVEFCDEYVAEAQTALKSLMHKGPTEDSLPDGWSLRAIRRKYVIWLTPELDEALYPFEQAMIEVGANSVFIEAVRESKKDHEARNKAIAKMFSNFAELMGFDEWNGKPIHGNLSEEAFVQILRHVLGTEELVALRKSILADATRNLKLADRAASD